MPKLRRRGSPNPTRPASGKRYQKLSIMRLIIQKPIKCLKNSLLTLFFVAAGIGILASIGLIPWALIEKFPPWLLMIIVICYILSLIIGYDDTKSINK